MMHRFAAILVFCSLVAISSNSWSQNGEWPVLRGPFLGQKPPGASPEVFAPGVISTEAPEGASWFTPDGRSFYFARARADLVGILVTEQTDGVWSEPRLATFSAGEHDWDFSLAPDGKTVFVASGRPDVGNEQAFRGHRIWVSPRDGERWSQPRLLPPPVNTGQHDSYPSVTADGTLYFFSDRGGGRGSRDIFKARRGADGGYPQVENLGAPVNGPHQEIDPFIAPDESFLIFCSDREGGFGKADFYVSFRAPDDSWTEPTNLGAAVNTAADEYIPSVTTDGRFFFFTSNVTGDRQIYWMDAGFIHELSRP